MLKLERLQTTFENKATVTSVGKAEALSLPFQLYSVRH